MSSQSVTSASTTTSSPASLPSPRRVDVALGQRSYEVLIGTRLLADADRLITAHCGNRRTAIVTDANVAAHHLSTLEASLGARNRGTVMHAAGEPTKSMAELGRTVDELLSLGVERGDLVVALGGGVIGDLAGFAASILRRGVRFVQIPTSLLAQVDSSVGGKTGINSRHGKNLIGAFHQPALVLADLDLLATLPARQMRAGYAEVVKYGLLGDLAFYERLETGWQALFGNDARALADAVETSVAAKAAIVARDETEQGDRMLLNLGHTFGHALEAWAGYSDRLLHGEAVSIGMAQAFRYSEATGFCPAGTAQRVEAHLRAVGLPTRVADIADAGKDGPSRDTLLNLMGQDKKVQDGKLTFILVSGIGAAYVARDVDRDSIAQFLDHELALARP